MSAEELEAALKAIIAETGAAGAKDMMVDEMADFYYQTFMGMADTFQRATQQTELVAEMKAYAKDFYKKFRDIQLKENK
jgi:ABC-type Fe3+-hydroxamate transport system substrate-binding protein